MSNTIPSDLDQEALNKAYEAYDKAFPESGFITYEGLRAGIRAYISALPSASSVPEAEQAPVAYRALRGASNVWGYGENIDDMKSMWGLPVKIEPLYGAPPVAMTSELSEAQQRLRLSEAVCYLEGTNRFAPGATLNKLIANGFHIATSYAAPPPVAAPSGEVFKNALDDLQQSEAEYRLMHDRHGDGAKATGRTWDLMRRAGNAARALLDAPPSSIASEPKDAGSGEGQPAKVDNLGLIKAVTAYDRYWENNDDASEAVRCAIEAYLAFTRTAPSGGKP